MVMHVELALLGGHILMGTDAPESMGFTVTSGNNVHINLEPDTRAEAYWLFNALGAGGTVQMPLQGMLGRLLRRSDRPVRHPLDGELRQQGVSTGDAGPPLAAKAPLGQRSIRIGTRSQPPEVSAVLFLGYSASMPA